jgi:endogenous inhibitor of DNA gyrase (YacG/DUF329 family)
MAGKKIPCPICRKDVAFGDPNMPFCSDRCRLLDLGNWASGTYVIPGPPLDEGELDELEERDSFKGPAR